jgi:hypothetical protein
VVAIEPERSVITRISVFMASFLRSGVARGQFVIAMT